MKFVSLSGIIITFIAFFIGISCTPGRALVHNLPKQKTNKIFPRSEVQAAALPFYFFKKENDGIGKIQINNVSTIFKATQLEQLLADKSTYAFLVIRNDTILYERYFNKKTENDLFSSFSVAKSFTSTMLGIALGEGKIKSIQDPICDYFPELDRKTFGEITIEHLLQQTSGIKFKGIGKIYYSPNLKDVVLKIGQHGKAGEKFRYENGNSQLLGMLIERVYQKPIHEVFEEKVWKKIGTESSLLWAHDSKKGQQDKTFCCIDARARDYARMGKLWMQSGVWNGEQIIPADWMQAVKQPNNNNGAAINYKYQFWQAPLAYQCFSAAGMYGQMIFMCPEKNLMLIRFGERAKITQDDKFWTPVFLQLIDQL